MNNLEKMFKLDSLLLISQSSGLQDICFEVTKFFGN